MNKGKKRKTAAEQQKIRQQKNAERKKTVKIARLIVAVATGITTLCIAAAVIIPKLGEPGYSEKMGMDAVKGTTVSLTAADYTFLINRSLQSTYQKSGSSAGQFGLDTTKSLRNQNYSGSKTWFEHIDSEIRETLTKQVSLAEAALDAGYSLDDSYVKESVKSQMSKLEQTALEDGKNIDAFIKEKYGDCVTRKNIEKCLGISSLAGKYKSYLSSQGSYSDDELKKCIEDNKEDFYTCAYAHYTVSAVPSGSESSNSSISAEELAALEEKVKKFLKVRNADDFLALVEQFEREKNPAISDDALRSAKSESRNLSKCYDVSTAEGKWLSDSTRKKGDTTYIKDRYSYTAYLMLNPMHLDETGTGNVRHILITADTCGSDEKARKKAENILDVWKNGDNTEKSFAVLAKKYTEDPGSKENGGLYENVSVGQMVTEFNDWLFDSTRKPGDTGVVKTEYGYHIMYYCGAGKRAWENDAADFLRDSDYKATEAKILSEYPVTYDESLVDEIKTVTFKDTMKYA